MPDHVSSKIRFTFANGQSCKKGHLGFMEVIFFAHLKFLSPVSEVLSLMYNSCAGKSSQIPWQFHWSFWVAELKVSF